MAKDNHYAQEAKTKPRVKCPHCGRRAKERNTRYGIRSACDACNVWSWDRHPMVNAETHRARNEAHRAFDVLWKNSRYTSRKEAYKMLQQELGLSADECHIKFMSAQVAKRVPEAVEAIKAKVVGAVRQ